MEVEQFLTWLAVHEKVSASTQNQAKSALLFLYKEVLGIRLPWLDNIETAKRPKYLPVVLTVREVNTMLQYVDGTFEHGEVYMPFALARKYPSAGKSWPWQYIFPSSRISKDPRSDRISRHHADDKARRCMSPCPMRMVTPSSIPSQNR